MTATNLSTGKAINLNISGPAQAQPSYVQVDGFATFGAEFFGALPANLAAGAGLPLVPVLYGRGVFTFDAQGNLTSLSFTGHADDLCQLLQ